VFLRSVLEDDPMIPTGMRSAAIEALSRAGVQAVPQAIGLLRDLRRKDTARAVLLKVGAAAAPFLDQLFLEGNELISREAASIIAQIGPPAPAFFRKALRNDDPGLRRAAALALDELEPVDGLLAELVDLLSEREEDLFVPAVRALGRIGPPAAEAVPAILRLLEDPSYRVRLAATGALGGFGAKGGRAVPALLQRLTDRSAVVRLAAIEALGRIGPPARSALPALRGALAATANDALFQNTISEALARIEGHVEEGER